MRSVILSSCCLPEESVATVVTKYVPSVNGYFLFSELYSFIFADQEFLFSLKTASNENSLLLVF